MVIGIEKYNNNNNNFIFIAYRGVIWKTLRLRVKAFQN